MDHPLVERAMLTGYPYSDKRQEVGTDGLNKEVYTGDQIMIYEDEFYLVDELSSDAIEVLERHGATYEIAE